MAHNLADAAAQKALEEYKYDREHEIELNRATAALEIESLKPLLILNGGAVVAFSTLVGAIHARTLIDSQWIILPIGAWIGGLFLAALATATAWRSQRSFTRKLRFQREKNDIEERKAYRSGSRLQNAAMVWGGASLLLFGLGGASAAYGLTQAKTAPPAVREDVPTAEASLPAHPCEERGDSAIQPRPG